MKFGILSIIKKYEKKGFVIKNHEVEFTSEGIKSIVTLTRTKKGIEENIVIIRKK